MESAINKEDVRKEYFLKEKIYEYVMQNVEKALNNLCQDECDTTLENCDKVCAAKCGYDKMTGIVDYSQFCKLLNPSKVDEWDNELNLVENLSVDKIQSEIYELLYRSDTPDKVMGDNCGIYLQSKYSQAPSKQVIPTFLNLTRGARKERALQSIFQNIINNTDIIDILAGNSITVIPGSYSGTLSQAQITSGWKNSSPNKVGEYNEKVQLFVDASGEESKYYYFSELEIDDKNQDNLAEIEDVALNSDAYTVIEKPTPSDSYMILFWKVECIEERLYPDIIKIEENEFFYKKYVFYYTEKELQCFEKWCSSLKTNGKPMLDTALAAIQFLNDESEPVQFLTRLLSKVPFFNPIFPKAVMNDFGEMVRQKIDGTRKQKKNVEMINDMFIRSIEEASFNVEVLSDMIYQKILEE